jgi:hypothetical protein
MVVKTLRILAYLVETDPFEVATAGKAERP